MTMTFHQAEVVAKFRKELSDGSPLIGTWIQIESSDYAEMIGQAGYDWAAVDMEHGAFSRQSLPDIFRALELGGTAPFVRIANPDAILCQQAFDSGAVGIVIPRIESAGQLEALIAGCNWPPTGTRGVGFSRANLYGNYFDSYKEAAQRSFVVAQVESANAIQAIDEIASVAGLDAIMIGPYDLSASLGRTGETQHPEIQAAIRRVLTTCHSRRLACGIHVVEPRPTDLNVAIELGHRFIAYGTDARFFHSNLQNPRR